MNSALPIGSSDEIESRPWSPDAAALAETELAEALECYRRRGGLWPPPWERVLTIARALGMRWLRSR
jgi:hypothetical protein